MNNKFNKHTVEVTATINNFTKQVSINLCHQDKKLRKFKLEISEQLKVKVNDIHKKLVY